MLSWVFEMGKKFKQKDEVIHLAVDLLDRYFMQKDLKFDFS